MKAAFFILPFILLALTACDDKKSDDAQTQEAPIAIEVPPDIDQAPVKEDAPSQGFTWNGSAIDPMCIYALNYAGSSNETVDLATCTGNKGSKGDYFVTSTAIEDFGNGFSGYNLQCDQDACAGAAIQYKVIGEADDQFIVQSLYNGGGTGYFSHLGRYAINDGKLNATKSYGGGDRCNGGVDSASIKDGVVVASYNITPYDLVDISGGNTAKFEAYDELPACAACCIGTADYEGDAMVSVTMTQDPASVIPEDLGPLDACYYGTYNEMYKEKSAKLDAAALKEFGEKFSARCSQLKGKDLPPTIKSGAEPNATDQPESANP
ncbi:MAG TPA: hypothetical protein VIN59_02255 [Alphaproteobacteria bacterium]